MASCRSTDSEVGQFWMHAATAAALPLNIVHKAMRHRLIFLFVLLALKACTSPEVAVDHAEDVGGSAMSTGMWLVDSAPALLIPDSSSDGAPDLLSPVAATRLSGNVIVTADRHIPSVQFLTIDGRVRREVGRRGGGPGEFQEITWLGQCAADSVFVWDGVQGRITVLNSEGDYVRQYRVPPQTASLACNRSCMFAALDLSRRLYS